jgi:two-component system nitrate/nitrite response regulator NarL
VIRVLVAADVRLHRDGVAALLREDNRVLVAATVPASDDRPPDGLRDVDVIVLDTAAEDGLSLVRAWARAGRPIVAMGIPRADEHVLAFAETGVLGFVERDATVEELSDSVEAAARGEASCPPRVATTLLRRIAAPTRPPSRTDSHALTARERQIVELIAEGLSNKEIGRRLYIEVATVKNHVHNILEKLQVNRRGEAAARIRMIESVDELHVRSRAV